MSGKQIQGWIEDTNDPWIGFICNGRRAHGDLPPNIVTPPPKPEFCNVEVFIRVARSPERARCGNFPDGELIWRVHPEDVERITGQRNERVFVCSHMGRFVE